MKYWVAFASVFVVSVPIAIMKATSAIAQQTVGELDVQLEQENHREEEESSTNVPSDDVKMYPVSMYSLSDINDVLVNISERPGIIINEMRNPSNFQGSTLVSAAGHHTAQGGGYLENEQNVMPRRAGDGQLTLTGSQSASASAMGHTSSSIVESNVEEHPAQPVGPVGPPMWAVGGHGAASSGLLNAEEEVAKFFGKPTVFEEADDEDVKVVLQGTRSNDNDNGSSS